MKRLTETMVLLGSVACARLRRVADVGAAVRQVAHDRRQQRRARPSSGSTSAMPLRTVGDQRVGGAEVDADRQPVLVRRRRDMPGSEICRRPSGSCRGCCAPS